MPCRGWLSNNTSRRILVAFAVAFAITSTVQSQENGDQKQKVITAPVGQPQINLSRPPHLEIVGVVSPEKAKLAEPDWAKPNCDKPGSHDEADLCQQVRMSEAAQNTVALNYVQIGIGILTLIGLAFTVFYTRTTADAAVDAARTAKQGLESIERAFVFLKHAYATGVYRDLPQAISPGAKALEGWDFHIVWENAGSTPTQHMFTYKNMLIFDGSIPDNFSFPDVVSGFGPRLLNRTFIGPKAIIDAGALHIPLEVMRDADSKNKRIYVWGWAEYSDIFRPKLRSRSEFCFQIVITGRIDQIPDDMIKPPFQFVAYNKHNGSADECFRQPGDEIPLCRLP